MTLTEVQKRFLRHCESAVSLSPHTIKAYRSDIDDFQIYLGMRKKIEVINKNNFRQYILHLREPRNFKESTIKRRLASLKLMFKWAVQEEILEINPFDSLNERIRLPKRLPRALDRGDRLSLRKAVAIRSRIDDFDTIWAKTAIHLLLDTGIRVGELVAINIRDLSLTDSCLVIQGKGNRQRLVYLLQKPLFRKIEQYLAWRISLSTCNEKLFVTTDGRTVSPPKIREVLRGISKEAGISKRVTPHMLRHTCATQWLEAGLDIRYVQKLLGHQSISTTEIYTHVSDQGLREALSRATGVGKR